MANLERAMPSRSFNQMRAYSRSKGGSASRDQLDDQHYERDHEKDVNETAECVRRNNTNQPQY
jgi:hypothetical protein